VTLQMRTLDPLARSRVRLPPLCRTSAPPRQGRPRRFRERSFGEEHFDEVIFCFPGVAAIMHHRLAHDLYWLGAPLLARIVAEIAHALAGVDIHPGAEIKEGFFINHRTGVVIGETAVIGRNVRIYQAVTLGAKRFEVGGDGEVRKSYPRRPIVEDDVVIYPAPRSSAASPSGVARRSAAMSG
jgi:serine acetyltransferase